MMNEPTPGNRDYDRDPNIKALKMRKGYQSWVYVRHVTKYESYL